jgi:hypothetical protein
MIQLADAAATRRLRWLWILFGVLLELRLLYPLFNSPLDHRFSDPQRHWENGLAFLHPSIMGSDDPYLYQLWLYLLQRVAGNTDTLILLGCGLLCALMPYGWYRALRELMPREAALTGAVLMAVVPDFVSIYGYFMNETLLLTLTGFAFWLTFRARRKRTVAAFAAASALWIAASFTRAAAVPLAAVSLLWIGWPAPHRALKLLCSAVLFLLVAIPAGLHGQAKLGFFAPFGNLYLHHIYRDGGRQRIELDLGPEGSYWFVSPSFANPTFYPFSGWTTDRQGTTKVTIDLSHGRADWDREEKRVAQKSTTSTVTDTLENFLFLAFGQTWPNNDRSSVSGWLTVWLRWIWMPMIGFVAWGLLGRRFRGPETLLPVSGLIVFLWLGLQQSAIVEGRFRLPLEPIFLASAFVLSRRLVHEPVLRAGP